MHMMSGDTWACSAAKSFPVRPKPVAISSKISNTSSSSQSLPEEVGKHRGTQSSADQKDETCGFCTYFCHSAFLDVFWDLWTPSMPKWKPTKSNRRIQKQCAVNTAPLIQPCHHDPKSSASPSPVAELLQVGGIVDTHSPSTLNHRFDNHCCHVLVALLQQAFHAREAIVASTPVCR